MLECGDLKKGTKLTIDGDPYIITEFQFVKPGKGQALYKCKLKNMVTGSQLERTWRSGEKFEEAVLEEVEMEYLYADGDKYCFMNSDNFEQELLSADQVGDNLPLLKENTKCDVLFYNGRAIGVTLPNFVVLRITESLPWAKGDTATNDTKPATLETGHTVQVPAFVEEGQLIRIDTRTGQYVERVKE